MCRGAELGICCAQGCDEKIRCQDTGGYCNEHDPFDYSWSDDGEPEVRPIATDDPEKRRIYTLGRVNLAIKQAEDSLTATRLGLLRLRAREAELASSPDPHTPKRGTP